jgi:hypothetical protein
VDSWTRKDRASQAESLLGHRIFGEAMLALRQRYHDQIEALPLGAPGLIQVHTKLKVLEEIVGELRSIIADPRLHRTDE